MRLFWILHSFISYNRREPWLNELAVKRVNGIDNDSTLWSQLSLLKNGPRKEQATVAVTFYIQTGKGRCTHYGKLEIVHVLLLLSKQNSRCFSQQEQWGIGISSLQTYVSSHGHKRRCIAIHADYYPTSSLQRKKKLPKEYIL